MCVCVCVCVRGSVCVGVCVRVWVCDRERAIHYLKIDTAVEMKEIAHHFRRWGQRNET